MDAKVNIGDKLFHKYLGVVTVKYVDENGIGVFTTKGILCFNYYDFGKVLYYDKEHSRKSFKSFEEYQIFCEETARLKSEAEAEMACVKLMQNQPEDDLHKEFEKLSLQSQRREIKQQEIFEKKIEAKIYTKNLMDEFYPKRETLLKLKKDQEGKIKEILKKRKIDYFFHFTRVENIPNILVNGLVPVGLQYIKNIQSIHNDFQRIDSKLNCTSCSVGFPNYKLFYTFREIKFKGTKWVLVAINPEVLFSPTNIPYYCQTNAASVFPGVLSTKELCEASSFENMFCECITSRENRLIHRSALQVNDYFTTDPQAEILISDIIDTKYIAKICFQSQRDYDDYVKKYGPEQINNFKYQVVPEFYNARKDFMFWKREN